MTRLLLVEEAADRLRCDPATVRRWVRAGKLQAHRPGNRLLVDPASVDRLINLSIVVPDVVPEVRVRRRQPPATGSFRERAKLARNG